MLVIVNQHSVNAVQIASVQPLHGNGGPMSPDAGVLLILEDGSKHRWLLEDGVIPVVGFWLVHDADLHVRYLVTADKFVELFAVVE